MMRFKLKSETKTKDRGAKHILKQIESIGKGASFTTGLHSPEGSMLPRSGGVVDGKVTIAQYAFWNEFGAPNAKIPARPTFGPLIRNHKAKFLKQTAAGMRRVYRGKTVGSLLTLQGKRARVWLRTAIWNLNSPANSSYTLNSKKRRGRGSNPLLDSGSMHNAISSKVQYPGKLSNKMFRNGHKKIKTLVRGMKP